MADRLFWATVRFSLTGNGQATLGYDVSAGQEFEIHRLAHVSTGAFSILDIADQRGNRFTNASSSQPLSQNIIPDLDTDNNNPMTLPEPLRIQGNNGLNLTLLDTSGSSNTVDITMVGVLRDK